MTKEEILDKIDWEGGIAEAILGYGLSFEDLPENAPPEVRYAWKELQEQGQEWILTIDRWLGEQE